MTTEPQTRRQVLLLHLQNYQRSTGRSMETFAAGVAELYLNRVPEQHAAVPFKRGGDAYKDARANALTLSRYLHADRLEKFPCGLEEAFILAFPEEWRIDLITKLSGRLGLLAVPIPALDDSARNATTADLLQVAGMAVSALGKLDTDEGRAAARLSLERLMGIAASQRASLDPQLIDLSKTPENRAH